MFHYIVQARILEPKLEMTCLILVSLGELAAASVERQNSPTELSEKRVAILIYGYAFCFARMN
jgi:hypothetical protein